MRPLASLAVWDGTPDRRTRGSWGETVALGSQGDTRQRAPRSLALLTHAANRTFPCMRARTHTLALTHRHVRTPARRCCCCRYGQHLSVDGSAIEALGFKYQVPEVRSSLPAAVARPATQRAVRDCAWPGRSRPALCLLRVAGPVFLAHRVFRVARCMRLRARCDAAVNC